MVLSSLRCANCDDRLLDPITTGKGVVHRCSECQWLFLEENLLLGYSDERSASSAALGEARALTLPGNRLCPRCGQPLHDGRVKSRGVLLAMCPRCQALWTDFATLEGFDPGIERVLHAQVDLALRDLDKEEVSELE